MKRDLFRRYVWLIDTIRCSGGITFEDISRRWDESPCNTDNSPFALRTFHNHRHAIADLFGIRIICRRGHDHNYRIAGWPNHNPTKLKMWMLQKLSFADLDDNAEPMKMRLLLDRMPEEKFDMNTVIEAIQNNKVIRIDCSLPTSDNKTSLNVAPYCMRCWHNKWYILAKDMETGKLRAFDLERVVEIKMTDESFEFPKNFKPENYFRNFYGMGTDTDKEPEQVKIKISGKKRDELRLFPLHVTQKEVMSTPEFSVFELHLVPDEEFESALLSHGSDTEVLHPEYLRASMADRIRKMAQIYKN